MIEPTNPEKKSKISNGASKIVRSTHHKLGESRKNL